MRWRLCLFLFSFPLALTALDSLSSFGEIKDEILRLESALKDADTSELHYKLARAFYFDQEIDKAFHHFLAALEKTETLNPRPLSEEENILYTQALDEYLAKGGEDPYQLAKEILAKYGQKADENRDFLHLNFLMSTAYGNLGDYETFFERFYAAYPYLKSSFLAYKTQGILYLKLSTHGRLEEERRSCQKKALHYLTFALDQNPKDAGLYKVLTVLAKNEQADALLLSYLEKMVEYDVRIPRGDIYLYVREAVALEKYELGQQIIDRAKSMYDFSRALSAAQDYLNQHRG